MTLIKLTALEEIDEQIDILTLLSEKTENNEEDRADIMLEISELIKQKRKFCNNCEGSGTTSHPFKDLTVGCGVCEGSGLN